MATPVSPSTPPVSHPALFATSLPRNTELSVSISSVNRAVRSTIAPSTAPAAAPAAAPISSPLNGSPQPCTDAIPLAYAPSPKNRLCPSVTTPA